MGVAAQQGMVMIWLDGAIFPDSHAPFDLSDRGLLLGDGAFDTGARYERARFPGRRASGAPVRAPCPRLGSLPIITPFVGPSPR